MLEMKNVDFDKLSTMMKQYFKTKEQYPDTVLFYRLGDFYEMFFDDAIKVSRELEIALTGRDCGLSERAPMCGVPHHSASGYIARLIERGYKVAICEQMEEAGATKGIVRREVVRIVTPGTVSDPEYLDEKKNNYLAVVYGDVGGFGVAFSDISTGEIFATGIDGGVADELMRYSPSEILIDEYSLRSVPNGFFEHFGVKPDVLKPDFYMTDGVGAALSTLFGSVVTDKDGLGGSLHAQIAIYATLRYFRLTQKSDDSFIHTLHYYKSDQYMNLDSNTRRNLEITETMRDKSRRGSILGTIDYTATSMGARLLKQWIEKPLLNIEAINKRLYAVSELCDSIMLRDDLHEQLGRIYDIARIHSRVSMGSVTPKELLSLRASIENLPRVKQALSNAKNPYLAELYLELDTLADLYDYLSRAIDDGASGLLRDGGIIKDGFSEELDSLRDGEKNGAVSIAKIEAKERERTGIKTLKIGYNKVFGYYIEIRKSNKTDVPAEYIRKQTLANAERYITPELKDTENFILGATERIRALEAELYRGVVNTVRDASERIRSVCNVVSIADVLCSFALCAFDKNYVMPKISDNGVISITDGRHPVVEASQRKTLFVPNDTFLDADENRMLIITGPNMAGKSTYMRQVAVISLLAQIGSFVPATSAQIGIVDKIFTRVGASDDIASGQSTFMVEMTEVANILKNATNKSLVILDEIGRGTSTFDGLSIAWAVVEYMQDKKLCGAKTLFATHYHELTELEDKLEGVKNYNIAVKKRGDDITFLRKIVRGGADDSYGIEVAALAGVPKKVISRAKDILKAIENDDDITYKKQKQTEGESPQMDFSDSLSRALTTELASLDATTLTPIEAMNKLYEICRRAKEI